MNTKSQIIEAASKAARMNSRIGPSEHSGMFATASVARAVSIWATLNREGLGYKGVSLEQAERELNDLNASLANARLERSTAEIERHTFAGPEGTHRAKMLAGVSLTDAAIETRFVAAGRRVSLLTSELADAQQTVSVARNAAKAKQDAALILAQLLNTLSE